MSAHRPHRLHSVAAAALVGVVVTLLAGCDPAAAGAAALVGGYKITENEIQGDATAIRDVVDRIEGQQPAGAALLPALVQNRVRTRLVTVAAAREGVTVTQGEIDQLVLANGGLEILAERLAQADGQWVPPDGVEDAARTLLLQQELAVKLAPAGSPQDQAVAVTEYLSDLAEELGVEISARYGTWDPALISVGPLPNDLSEPASGAGATPEPQPGG